MGARRPTPIAPALPVCAVCRAPALVGDWIDRGPGVPWRILPHAWELDRLELGARVALVFSGWPHRGPGVKRWGCARCAGAARRHPFVDVGDVQLPLELEPRSKHEAP